MIPERYVPKKISEISKSDRKLSLVGKIIEFNEENSKVKSFVMDDNTGKIEIFIGGEFEESIGEKNKTVRAFCVIVGDRLMLDVLQHLDGLDLNLLKTVDDLYSRAGV